MYLVNLVVILCLTFRGTIGLFVILCTPFIFPPADCEECTFSTFILIYVGSLCCFGFVFFVCLFLMIAFLCVLSDISFMFQFVFLFNNIEHLFIFDSLFCFRVLCVPVHTVFLLFFYKSSSYSHHTRFLDKLAINMFPPYCLFPFSVVCFDAENFLMKFFWL